MGCWGAGVLVGGGGGVVGWWGGGVVEVGGGGWWGWWWVVGWWGGGVVGWGGGVVGWWGVVGGWGGGRKQEASKPCRKHSPILLGLVGVLNILENKKPANHAEQKQPHFVSASCRAQHPGGWWVVGGGGGVVVVRGGGGEVWCLVGEVFVCGLR